MLTNCENCTFELDEDDICKCDVCGQDGLCPHCSSPEFHNCEEENPE